MSTITFGAAGAPPPPTDTNLVSNGGFEAGTTGWTHWGNTQVLAGQSYAGSSALSVGTAAGGGGYDVDGTCPGRPPGSA